MIIIWGLSRWNVLETYLWNHAASLIGLPGHLISSHLHLHPIPKNKQNLLLSYGIPRHLELYSMYSMYFHIPPFPSVSCVFPPFCIIQHAPKVSESTLSESTKEVLYHIQYVSIPVHRRMESEIRESDDKKSTLLCMQLCSVSKEPYLCGSSIKKCVWLLVVRVLGLVVPCGVICCSQGGWHLLVGCHSGPS